MPPTWENVCQAFLEADADNITAFVVVREEIIFFMILVHFSLFFGLLEIFFSFFFFNP